MRFFKQGPLGVFGALLLIVDLLLRLVVEWRPLRVALEMANLGQAVDFVLQHWQHPGWLASLPAQITIVAICLFLIFWDRKKPSWLPSPEVSPRQMIIGGLIVIVIGVVVTGIGIWRQSATGVEIGKSVIGESNAPTQILIPQEKPKRKYTATDIPRLTPVLQKISDLISNIGAPLDRDLRNYLLDQNELIRQHGVLGSGLTI